MSRNELIKPEKIQNRIYTVRGVQVMLDKDLEDEAEFMVSQHAIPSKWFAFSKMDIGAVEMLGRLV